jgi:hypothetical protein
LWDANLRRLLISFYFVCHFRKCEVQREFDDFTEESRQLEQELETQILQTDKQINDLRYTVQQLGDEAESLRVSFSINSSI